MSTEPLSVGFIGSGMMASALMDGMVAKGLTTASNITCSDVYPPAREAAAKKGMFATDSNLVVCERAKDVLIIAVKPHIVKDVCADILEAASGGKNPHPLVISIAAGVTLETLEDALQCHDQGHRVVRVMPNTPCLVGQAATGFALGGWANVNDGKMCQDIFGSVGTAVQVTDETLLNAVTGLSGSGPAYVYQFIEALSDGGVRAGLTRAVATQLAAQTVKGAAEMVLQTGKHPGELKDAVTSPGGTTIAGVEALEQGGFRATTMSAVKAATRRSFQLGGMSAEVISHGYNL